MAAIRLSNVDMLSSLFDKKRDSKISHYVNVAIETRRRNEEFVLNACKYNLSNGPLEGKINKIKLIKRNAFCHRNFYNYKKRIFLPLKSLSILKMAQTFLSEPLGSYFSPHKHYLTNSNKNL